MKFKSATTPFLLLALGLLTALQSCERPSLGLPDPLTDFSASLQALSPEVSDGEDFTLIVRANRGFVLERLSCEWEPRDLTEGATCELSHDSLFTIVFPAVSIAEDHIGTAELLLYDSVTGRTLTLRCAYTALSHRTVYPSGIVLSRGSLSVDWYDEAEPSGGIESFDVSMNPEDAETGFSVEVLSGWTGKISISTQKEGEYAKSCSVSSNRGTIYVKGGSEGGEARIRITPTISPEATSDVRVYVRHRVALMIYGSFYEQSWDPGHTGGMDTGWYGVPSGIRCRLVGWDLTGSDVSSIEDIKADNIDALHLHDFTSLQGCYALDMRLSVSPEQRISDMFFGPNGGDCARLVFNYNEQVSATLPPSGQQLFPFTDLRYDSEGSLPALCSALSDINDNTYWVGRWTFLNIQGYRHTTEWSDVSVRVDAIDYDRDRLDLRYCLYMFSACYSSGRFCGVEPYWWADVDHVPWLQKWED